MTQCLSGKKILFMSPAFFNYEYTIKCKMEQLGATVVFFDERSVTSAFERALLKISPKIFSGKSYKYFKSIIESNKDADFDYILIVKCDMVSVRTLKELKLAYPKAKLCLHIWDAVKNIPGIAGKIKYFDYATSFDRNDCAEYAGLNFRPLFYSDDFCGTKTEHDNYKYDIAFCGTIHSDRYDVLRKIEKICCEKKLKYGCFYYLQSRFIYRFYKLTKNSFKDTEPADFSFIKKSHAEIAAIEDASAIIVDIQHPAQSGLTMRTIEMVGLEKKLITTNADIVNYDFYDGMNICVIDRKNPVLDEPFLNTPYKPLSDDIYKKYSLTQWILDVLGLGEINE